MELRRSKRVRDPDLVLAMRESLKQLRRDQRRRRSSMTDELTTALSPSSPPKVSASSPPEVRVYNRRKRNKTSAEKEVEPKGAESEEQEARNNEEPEPQRKKTSPEESEPMNAEHEAASSRQVEHEASEEPENEKEKSGGTDQAVSERDTECRPEDKSAETISDEHAYGDEQNEAKAVLIPKLSKRRKAPSRSRALTRKKKRKKDIVRKHFGFAEPVKPKDLAEAAKKYAEEAVYCLLDDDGCQSLEGEIKEQRDGIRFAYPSCDDPDAVEVHQSDIQCLKDNEYINDTVIDLYIKFLKQSKSVPTEQVHIFNSFFFKKLATAVSDERGMESVDLLDKLRKWIRGGNIFEKTYLVVPVHDRLHWSLAIICFSESKPGCHILHLDSMKTGHSSQIVYEVLRRYLLAEWRSRGSVKVNSKDIRVRKVKVPQQENGYDCGLFMLHFIEQFLSKAPPSFSDDVSKNMYGWFSSIEASELRTSIRNILQGFLDEKKNEQICNEENQDDVTQEATGNKVEETNDGQDTNPTS